MDTYDFEKIDKAMLATTHLDLYAVDQFALGFQAVGCAIALSRGEAVPATYTIGSDQYPATVFVASRTGNALYATLDVARGGGISIPNVDITKRRKYTLRRDGTYREVGRKHGSLSVGRRRLYLDPSF